LQDKATSAYALWKANPAHPSLRFKKVHATIFYNVQRCDRPSASSTVTAYSGLIAPGAYRVVFSQSGGLVCPVIVPEPSGFSVSALGVSNSVPASTSWGITVLMILVSFFGMRRLTPR